MTDDKAQAFIDAVFERIEGGELPTVSAFSDDEKQALVWMMQLVKTPRQREMAALFMARVKDERDVAAFGLVMNAGHLTLALMFIFKHLFTLPGAILAALIGSLIGGVKIADIVTILAKAL